MVFEEKSKNVIIKHYPEGTIVDRHIYLDDKRASKLSKIQRVYQNEVLKKMSLNLIMKIAIDVLIETLEEMSEEEAIELLKKQHKEAFF